MSRRSRKHRKHFPCGHRGYGRYCHRCEQQAAQQAAQLAREKAELVYRREQKVKWRATFAMDEIDLKGLPEEIVLKTREVLKKLAAGKDYWELGGKLLQGRRGAVRIPITQRYRLLCRYDGSSTEPLKVLSHEDYNPVVRNARRLFSMVFRRRAGF